MNSQSPVEAILFAALEKRTPEEQIAYLSAACGEDEDLRAKIGTGTNAPWEVRINGMVEMSGTGNLVRTITAALSSAAVRVHLHLLLRRRGHRGSKVSIGGMNGYQ